MAYIKILKKFEQWYQVETPDGTIGWMWGKLLSNKQKTVIFKNKENIIQIGIDHEAYGHLSIVSDRVREELAKEFI